jgi:hypothetical protein
MTRRRMPVALVVAVLLVSGGVRRRRFLLSDSADTDGVACSCCDSSSGRDHCGGEPCDGVN